MKERRELDILSVDVDAQLRKLPARRFRRPEHYVVELVLGALRRGAREVDVRIGRNAVQVLDDGGPVDADALRCLVAVVDADQADAERRRALEFFEAGEGLELLAAFAPGKAAVLLECGEGEERRAVKMRLGAAVRFLPPERMHGTVVRVERSGGARREREALVEYARFAAGTVKVDGRNVSAGMPADALAYARLPGGADHGPGHLWIPASGDACRVWGLEKGIRRKQAVLPADRGIVLHAALEDAGTLDRKTLAALRDEAAELYRLLARRYAALPSDSRGRADDLFFLLYRKDGPAELVEAFAPFRTLDGELLTLAAVEREVKAGRLCALRRDDRREQFDLGAGPVLFLTPAQWEFLADAVGLALARPPALPRARQQRGRRWLRDLWGRVVDALGTRLANRAEVVDAGALSAGERLLLEAIDEWGEGGSGTLLVAGRGPRPVALRTGTEGARRVLFRDHAETVAAAAMAARGELPGAVAAALLLRGETRATTQSQAGLRRDENQGR